MKKPVLLMDVGGTHTRIRIVAEADDMVARPEILAAANSRISDKDTLLRFMSGIIADNSLQDRIQAAVVCFAGVVTGQSAAMTNWVEPRNLNLSDIIQTGLPARRTIMANDMDAAAYCLIARIRGELDLELISMYSGGSPDIRRNVNSALIIPGTGVGVAGLLEESYARHEGNIVPVSCEVQHTPIPQLDGEHGRVLAAMRARSSGAIPTWEDFVSGKGLENIYASMLAAKGQSAAMTGLSAGDIAERAVNGTDSECAGALGLYYRCAGGLAQAVALTFQAFGGIYLAGETTRKNISFIRASRFLEQLHSNALRNELLRLFPVYLVANDLNLDGAAYMARRYLNINSGAGTQV